MKSKIQMLLIISTVFFAFEGYSQNLILNGDFEEFIKCPEGLRPLEKPKMLKHVTNPNKGSFDFIHTCDNEEGGYPRYRWGEESPHGGEGYTGIAVYQDNFFYIGGE